MPLIMLDKIDTAIENRTLEISDLIKIKTDALRIANDEVYPKDYREGMIARYNSIELALEQLAKETDEMISATDALRPRGIPAKEALVA